MPQTTNGEIAVERKDALNVKTLMRVYHYARISVTSMKWFFILLAYTFLIAVLTVVIFRLNSTYTTYIVLIPLFLAVSLELLAMFDTIALNVYLRNRHLSGKDIVLGYLQVVKKDNENRRENKPRENWKKLYATNSGHNFVEQFLVILKYQTHVSMELLAMDEFKGNFRKFVEVTFTSDNESSNQLYSKLIKTVESFFLIPRDPAIFLEDYYSLKKIYEGRNNYLRQFETYTLYDINKKRKRIPAIINGLITNLPSSLIALVLALMFAFVFYLIK